MMEAAEISFFLDKNYRWMLKEPPWGRIFKSSFLAISLTWKVDFTWAIITVFEI